jgi:transcriptional regulator with XRE-family HTH domain
MHDGNAYGEERFLTLVDRLRKHRRDAQLTQQEVADRAGLSARGFSDLERGLRQAPYRDTILRLADALAVDETERQAWLALARKGRIEQQRDPPAPGNLVLTQRPELVSAEPPVPGVPAPTPPTTERPLPPSHGPEGEHRPATIVSCQLADARSVAERFGVDAVLSLMDRLIQQATDEIHRYDGTLTVISHDGFVAVFGAPIAHEDHARRAVLDRAGTPGSV